MIESRILPHNIDAEIAVIGGILVNSSAMPNIIEILDVNDFYKEAHKLIFDAMVSLYRDKYDITHITLFDRLDKFGQLDQAGGQEYILSIMESVVTSAGWEYHCKIIKDKSQTRKIIESCSIAAESSFNRFIDNDEIINNLKLSIKEIEGNRSTEEESTPDLIYQKSKEIEKRRSDGNLYTGYLTCFENIDSRMRGLSKKTTTYLIARPSIGKTSLALNIGYNIANLYPDEQVLFFSLESSKSLLLDRLLSNLSGIPLSAIQAGNINDSRYPMLIDAYGKCELINNLWLYESSKFKRIDYLHSKCEVKASIKPISLIIIDHIQLTKHQNTKQSRNDQLGDISSEIADIAKDLNCHCLILSQLNRALENRPDNKPQLKDMRDSGNLEQNADNVWGLHREDKESDIAEIEQLKGRDKGTWKTELRFDRFTQRYQDKFEMKI